MTADALARQLAEKASLSLEPIYARLHLIAEEVLRVRPKRAALTEAHLSGLQRLLVELLGEESAAWGMGFVAAPSVVEGMERYLAWWQRRGERVARLRLNFDPASIDVYDYLQMDWYQLAQRGQGRVAYGPYVDYSGSDMYTITATIPIVADGIFLGVAGADLVVGEVEHRLVSALRQTAEDVVIVSTERRVISANTSRWLVGSRLAALPSAGPATDPSAFREVVDMPLGTGWVLAVAWPETAEAAKN
ncbi:MAG TPA: hypothetical protein VFK56_08015 [Mycobacterium sp.]|nr:hypothetical protein [Mycobacterium sp.]